LNVVSSAEWLTFQLACLVFHPNGVSTTILPTVIPIAVDMAQFMAKNLTEALRSRLAIA
jgi:hypothetical protein